MVSRDEKNRSRGLILFLALPTILGATNLRAGSGPTRLALGPTGVATATEKQVSTAVRQAATKLSDSGCQEVFSDFRDSSGRTMRENLDALGQSPQGYLDLIVFYDGHGYSRCDARNIFATTSPGSRVVYICAPQFLEKLRREPGQAAALIIHEELHSLGLGENPPDSKEITARVIARCGQ
jgi:hypothetical protein